jgi:hypothetical protein
MGKTAIMERLFNITFNELATMLPNRFWYEYLTNMPEDETVEMVKNWRPRHCLECGRNC